MLNPVTQPEEEQSLKSALRPGFTLLHAYATDDQGRPIPGVRIRLMHAGRETTTNGRGYYRISVPTPPETSPDIPGTDTLIAQKQGYKTIIHRNMIVAGEDGGGIFLDMEKGTGVIEFVDTHRLIKGKGASEAQSAPMIGARSVNAPSPELYNSWAQNSTQSKCADRPLCKLGASVVEQMNMESISGGRINPTALAGSLAFLGQCPASMIPAFKRFSENEQKLRGSWIESLKSGSEVPDRSEIRGFLAVAKESVGRDENASLKKFVDGIFEAPETIQKDHRMSVGRLYAQLSANTLKQFSHCDGAECYDMSDFLLFLINTQPTAFFEAMHADQPDTAKWLSELGNLSFTGDPSERQYRNSIKNLLIERMSEVKAPEFVYQEHQIENALRELQFRTWK